MQESYVNKNGETVYTFSKNHMWALSMLEGRENARLCYQALCGRASRGWHYQTLKTERRSIREPLEANQVSFTVSMLTKETHLSTKKVRNGLDELIQKGIFIKCQKNRHYTKGWLPQTPEHIQRLEEAEEKALRLKPPRQRETLEEALHAWNQTHSAFSSSGGASSAIRLGEGSYLTLPFQISSSQIELVIIDEGQVRGASEGASEIFLQSSLFTGHYEAGASQRGKSEGASDPRGASENGAPESTQAPAFIGHSDNGQEQKGAPRAAFIERKQKHKEAEGISSAPDSADSMTSESASASDSMAAVSSLEEEQKLREEQALRILNMRSLGRALHEQIETQRLEPDPEEIAEQRNTQTLQKVINATEPKQGMEEGFLEFWKLYPHQSNRHDYFSGFTFWQRLRSAIPNIPSDWILQALKEELQKTEGRALIGKSPDLWLLENPYLRKCLKQAFSIRETPISIKKHR